MPNYDYYGYSSNPYWTKGVKFLILTNLGIFVLQVLFRLLPYSWGLESFLKNYFALWPNKIIDNFFLWQLITSAFLHDVNTLWHLFFNLLTLYFLGFMVERHYGTTRFLIFYFLCACFSGFVYTMVHFVYQTRTYMLGASGAIMGILMLAGCLYPTSVVYFQFLFPMKMRTILWIVIGIEMYTAIIHSSQGIAVEAHLGGLFFGYLYYRYSDRFLHYMDRLEKRVMQKYEKEREKTYKNIREEVDRILDKINKEGIHSLTKKEKEFLKRASQEYQREQ